MRKFYFFVPILVLLLCVIAAACSDQDDDFEYVPVSPVVVDLTLVPYEKLSDYKFFTGELKDLEPALGVLPYIPSSSLFSDYAHKKRFVWMPSGSKATYNGADKILELPVGAVLIKNFYYENVQNIVPAGGTRLIETRLMIRKADGWIFADYIWNDEQTEAFFSLSGSYTEVAWKDENNVVKSTNYRIPAHAQCIVCHKQRVETGEGEVTVHIPIGIKPQNLNYPISYGSSMQNQLQKWIAMGYLEGDFQMPDASQTVIDYSDISKPVELRVRSYVDANCSHCHSPMRHCDYRPMNLAFTATGGPNGRTNLGVCVSTEDMQDFPPELDKIVNPGRAAQSMMFYRINTTDEAYRMPLHGRTVIHEEAIGLFTEWINSLPDCE